MPRLTPPAARPTRFRIEERTPLWWLRWVPAALLAAAILYLVYIVGRVAIIPVLASFGIAYVLNPIVEAFQKRGLSRALASFTALVVVATAIVLFLWFVIPDLWAESVKATDAVMSNLNVENAQAVRHRIQEISPMLDRMIGYRVYLFLHSPNDLIEFSQRFFAGGLTDFLTTAASALDLLLVPFFVFYILVDFPRWRLSVDELIPPRFREPFSRLFDEVGRILQSYVLGQIMIAIIMGGLYAGGFAIFQVPAWAGLAALSGFLNVIPYVGTGAGLVLASSFTFAHSGQIWRVAGVVGVFAAVQSIEGYYLTPRILGGRLSLHPMAVFLGLLIGGRLFGLLGVLLAVPVIAVALVFLKFFREIYRSSEMYRAGEIGPEPIPPPVEEVIAQAADTVLSEQVEKQEGDEVLAPAKSEDDPAALRKP